MIVEEMTSGQGQEGMPSSREDWIGIMRFWADVLGTRTAGTTEDMYRVVQDS